MNSRDRVLTALNHEEPDRAPIDLGGYQSGMNWRAYKKLKSEISKRNKDLKMTEGPNEIEILELNQGLAKVAEEIKKEFGIDTRYVFPQPPSNWELELKYGNGQVSYTDWWGVERVKLDNLQYFEPIEHPLGNADLQGIQKYQWPSIDKGIFEGVEEKAKKLHKRNNFAISTTVPGLFETSWYLTGFSRILKSLVSDLDFVENLLDEVLEVLKEYYDIYLREVGQYLDIVQFYDDLGGQDGPLFDPDIYRNVLKPRHRDLVKLIKKKTDAKVAQHTDGVLRPFLDDLIEIDIDIINPVQVSAVGNQNTGALNEEFGEEIAFWGGIDTQNVLPYGNRETVEREVKKRLEDLAPGGGYLLSSVHNIQSDVPPENIIAMYETAMKWHY